MKWLTFFLIALFNLSAHTADVADVADEVAPEVKESAVTKLEELCDSKALHNTPLDLIVSRSKQTLSVRYGTSTLSGLSDLKVTAKVRNGKLPLMQNSLKLVGNKRLNRPFEKQTIENSLQIGSIGLYVYSNRPGKEHPVTKAGVLVDHSVMEEIYKCLQKDKSNTARIAVVEQ